MLTLHTDTQFATGPNPALGALCATAREVLKLQPTRPNPRVRIGTAAADGLRAGKVIKHAIFGKCRVEAVSRLFPADATGPAYRVARFLQLSAH